MHVGGAFVVVLIVGLIEIDYVGIMYWWDIDLNAISSVNRKTYRFFTGY